MAARSRCKRSRPRWWAARGLAGGAGGVGTAVLAPLFVTILSNGMDLAQMNGYVQMIALGAIVIIGVVLDRLRLKRR